MLGFMSETTSSSEPATGPVATPAPPPARTAARICRAATPRPAHRGGRLGGDRRRRGLHRRGDLLLRLLPRRAFRRSPWRWPRRSRPRLHDPEGRAAADVPDGPAASSSAQVRGSRRSGPVARTSNSRTLPARPRRGRSSESTRSTFCRRSASPAKRRFRRVFGYTLGYDREIHDDGRGQPRAQRRPVTDRRPRRPDPAAGPLPDRADGELQPGAHPGAAAPRQGRRRLRTLRGHPGRQRLHQGRRIPARHQDRDGHPVLHRGRRAGQPGHLARPARFRAEVLHHRRQLRHRRQQHPGVLHPRSDEVPALHPLPEAHAGHQPA